MPSVKCRSITHTYRNVLTETQFMRAIMESSSTFLNETINVWLACLDLLLLNFWHVLKFRYIFMNTWMQILFSTMSSAGDVNHLLLDSSLMMPVWSVNSVYHSTHPAILTAPADCKTHGKYVNPKRWLYQIKCWPHGIMNANESKFILTLY